MKRVFLVFHFSFLIFNSSFSQNPGEWMWIHGSNAPNSNGSHGTIGMPSALNEPPALYEVCEWTDTSGNFWFYGGLPASATPYNDLWKYDPVANQWTWMKGTAATGDPGIYGIKGVASAANRPPSLGYAAASWVDTSGNFWMFGGWNNNPYGYYSDLWKYNVGTNEWTWMNGPGIINSNGVYGIKGTPDPANYPWSRTECSSAWTDKAGDLWLFSGGGTTGFNDLWRYHIATNTWTWMKGANSGGQAGVYGAQGVEDTANTPGGRWSHSKWKDNKGNFWFYGGYASSVATNMSDLWRFNPVSNSWAWINGSNTGNDFGVYGIKCIMSPSNSPGSRYENRATWTDTNNNFWMFGGVNYASLPGSRMLNDLWKYCVATNQWTWESGDATYNPAGSWGTIAASSPANKPSGRCGSAGWTDKKGHLYLFGGTAAPFVTPYNDLWVYAIDNTCSTCAQGLPVADFISSETSFCSETGKCISFTDHSTGNPTSWHWLFTGAIPDTSSQQNPINICYYSVGTYAVTLIVTNAGGSDTLTVSPMITVGNVPQPPVITVGNGDTLFCSHAAHYQWYFNGSPIPNATDSFYVAHQGGTYSVQIADGNGCNSLSNGLMVGQEEISSDGGIEVYPNPAGEELFISHWSLGISGIGIFNVLGEKVYDRLLQTPNKKQETINVKSFSSGIYILKVTLPSGVLNSKIIINR